MARLLTDKWIRYREQVLDGLSLVLVVLWLIGFISSFIFLAILFFIQ